MLQTDISAQDDFHIIDIPISNLEMLSSKTTDLYQKRRSSEKGAYLSFSQILEKKIRIAEGIADEWHLEIALHSIGLLPLVVFFYFEEVTELFYQNGEFGYTRRDIGRSPIIFPPSINGQKFYESVKLQAELAADQILSPRNPSLVANLNSRLGNLRIMIKMPPLGNGIVIRRLPSHPLTLQDLVLQRQISDGYAEFLKSACLARMNIVICGEPGAGKTTLLNALLLELPKAWRIVIMEDTKELSVEGVFCDKFSTPQVKIFEKGQKHLKENIIALALKNSPDYLVFGEIQQPEDTETVFEGFAAGLKGIVTTHAKSMETLMVRWKESHKLSPELLQTIDIVVVTKRSIDFNGKITLSVEEIHRRTQNGQFEKYVP